MAYQTILFRNTRIRTITKKPVSKKKKETNSVMRSLERDFAAAQLVEKRTLPLVPRGKENVPSQVLSSVHKDHNPKDKKMVRFLLQVTQDTVASEPLYAILPRD